MVVPCVSMAVTVAETLCMSKLAMYCKKAVKHAGIPTHAPPSCVQVVTEHNREGVRAVRYFVSLQSHAGMNIADVWI